MSRVLPVVALLTAVLTIAGCGSAPSRVGAAAIIGDRVVPTSLVQERLRTSAPDLQAALDARAAEIGEPPGAPVPPEVLAEQSRRLVGISVLHELTDEQSRRDGVTVGPRQVDTLLAGTGGIEAAGRGTGFSPEVVREIVTDRIAVSEIARRTFDRISVTVDYATLPDRARAEELVSRIAANPQRASAQFASLPRGTAETAQVLRPGRAATPGGPASATSVIYGLPEGTVAMTSAGRADGQGPQRWTVIHVIDRTLTAPPPAPGDVRAARVDDETLIRFGLRMLQPAALELGVRINPRYGAWDPTQLTVVTSPAEAGVVQPLREPTAP